MVEKFRRLVFISGWLFLLTQPLSAQISFSLDSDGYVHSWIVRGPFPARQPEERFTDHLTDLGGESSLLRWDGVDSVYWGDPVPQSKTFWQGRITEGIVLSFHKFLQPAEFGVVYAAVWLVSPRPQKAILKIGSDDGVWIWLNGQKVHEKPVYRSWEPDADEIPVQLKAGENYLLAKVSQGRGGWQLSIRVCRPDGSPLPGVRAWLPGELTDNLRMEVLRKSVRLRLEARYTDKKPVLVAVLRYTPILENLQWDVRLTGDVYQGRTAVARNALAFSWNTAKAVHFTRPISAPESPGIYELKTYLFVNQKKADFKGILFFW